MKRRRGPTCPRRRDERCRACDCADRAVAFMRAILRPDERPDIGWAEIRLNRHLAHQAMEAEAARRMNAAPKRVASGVPGPGKINECRGTDWTAMGQDDAGTDRDIDANGWYSNVRREYEEGRSV